MKEARYNEHILYDSIFMKFKNVQKRSYDDRSRTVVAYWRNEETLIRREDYRTFSGNNLFSNKPLGSQLISTVGVRKVQLRDWNGKLRIGYSGLRAVSARTR